MCILEYPLVSVIIPSYNHGKYIEESVKSVIGQTYNNFELIVIDDGSNDNSVSILRELSNNYGFKLVVQNNRGIAATLNRGIKEIANGKYISYCSSDDILLPNKLEVQVAYMEKNPEVAASSGGYITINSEGKEVKKKSFTYSEYNFKDVFVYGKRIPAPGTMLRKADVLKVGGYNENLAIDDAVMWLKLTELGYTISILPHVLFKYRRHSYNISKNHNLMRREQLKYYNLYKDHKLFNVALNNYYLREFNYLCKRDKKKAMQSISKVNVRYYDFGMIKSAIYLCLPKFLLKCKYS